MTSRIGSGRRSSTLMRAATLIGASWLGIGTAGGQALTVQPVTLTLQPKQQAAILTLSNGSQTDSSVQVRAFAWSQAADGSDKLDPTDAIAVSPPLGTIAPGHKQIVRLVLRRLPQDREATYRILVDQIPSPAQANEVRVALRFSLPIFAEPQARAVPHLRFGVELVGGKLYLVATNDGGRHETIREIKLRTARRVALTPVGGASPYILPGVTRRWLLADAPHGDVGTGAMLQLSAKTELSGTVDQELTVDLPR